MSKYLLAGSDNTLRRWLALAALATAASLGQASAQTATPVYQHWTLKASDRDSAAVRSAGIVATTPTFRRLVVSDGSAAATVRPYSALHGQALAPLAGGGGWSSNSTPPGPGSTLKRWLYQQFTVRAAAGSTVRADSLILNAGFLGTASGTNLGVAYSTSGFATDSVEISGGGKGPAGPLTGATNGSFTAPVALLQIPLTSPNNNTYRLALNGANGVTLNGGQTLTIRLYYSCSSSGATARFALVRDVIVKSRQAVVTSTRGIAKASSGLQVYPNPVQNRLTVAHPGAKTSGSITVFSATGQKAAYVTPQPGTTSTEVDLSRLTNGIYLVEYRNGNERVTGRVVKE